MRLSIAWFGAGLEALNDDRRLVMPLEVDEDRQESRDGVELDEMVVLGFANL